MLGSKLNIMNDGWRELVFADRNQAYGAYELRRQNAMNTNMALFIATGVFVLALASPTIYNKMRGYVPPKDPIADVTKIFQFQEVKIEQPKIISEPTDRSTSKPRNNVVLSLPPVVVNAQTAIDPPKDKILQNNDTGPATVKGTEDGALFSDKTPGTVNSTGTGTGAISDNSDGQLFETSEIEPAFPGGLTAFGKFLQNRIKYPAMARELGFIGKAYISFVVERDGSLTDIKIARDPGHGLGEEAMRVLKMSPHWVPGMQNGRTVRVSYTIPINFSLGED